MTFAIAFWLADNVENNVTCDVTLCVTKSQSMYLNIYLFFIVYCDGKSNVTCDVTVYVPLSLYQLRKKVELPIFF